ncbi:MAG: hypothetical protein LBT83_11960 [Tannerella sp.]|nr:hypothetical protein [Tannerella sp.]
MLSDNENFLLPTTIFLSVTSTSRLKWTEFVVGKWNVPISDRNMPISERKFPVGERKFELQDIENSCPQSKNTCPRPECSRL